MDEGTLTIVLGRRWDVVGVVDIARMSDRPGTAEHTVNLVLIAIE